MGRGVWMLSESGMGASVGTKYAWKSTQLPSHPVGFNFTGLKCLGSGVGILYKRIREIRGLSPSCPEAVQMLPLLGTFPGFC